MDHIRKHHLNLKEEAEKYRKAEKIIEKGTQKTIKEMLTTYTSGQVSEKNLDFRNIISFPNINLYIFDQSSRSLV